MNQWIFSLLFASCLSASVLAHAESVDAIENPEQEYAAGSAEADDSSDIAPPSAAELESIKRRHKFRDLDVNGNLNEEPEDEEEYVIVRKKKQRPHSKWDQVLDKKMEAMRKQINKRILEAANNMKVNIR